MGEKKEEKQMSVHEMTGIIKELRNEGWETRHIAAISAVADPEQVTNSAGKLKKVLEKDYGVVMPLSEIRRLLKNEKFNSAIARVFAKVRGLWLVAIEQNMMRAAADPDDKKKVEAARLVYQREGLLDQDDKKKIAEDPMAQLVRQMQEMRQKGKVEVEAVTGRVIVRSDETASSRLISQEDFYGAETQAEEKSEEERVLDTDFDEGASPTASEEESEESSPESSQEGDPTPSF